jgi:hypothetical protein
MFWKLRLRLLVFHHILQHHRRAARLYRSLAAQARNAEYRELLLKLGENAEQHARIEAEYLTLFGRRVPEDHTSLDYSWEWFLLRYDIKAPLIWLDSIDWVYARLNAVLKEPQQPGNGQAPPR